MPAVFLGLFCYVRNVEYVMFLSTKQLNLIFTMQEARCEVMVIPQKGWSILALECTYRNRYRKYRQLLVADSTLGSRENGQVCGSGPLAFYFATIAEPNSRVHICSQIPPITARKRLPADGTLKRTRSTTLRLETKTVTLVRLKM